MPTYKAYIRETLLHEVIVEADDEALASELAYNIVEYNDPSEYSTSSEGTFSCDIEVYDE